MTADAPQPPPARGVRTRPAAARLSPYDVVPALLLLVLGLLVGIWGALLVPAGPRVGGDLMSVGAALGVVGLPLLCRLGVRALPRFGGLAVLAGWLVAAIGLGTGVRSNGSVVLPGSGDLAVPGLVFLVGGAVLGGLAAFAGPRR